MRQRVIAPTSLRGGVRRSPVGWVSAILLLTGCPNGSVSLGSDNRPPEFNDGTEFVVEDDRFLSERYVVADPNSLPQPVQVTLLADIDDGSLFTLEPDERGDRPGAAGTIRSLQPLDFENPSDGDGDNFYRFTLRADDGVFQTDQPFIVEVVDIDETEGAGYALLGPAIGRRLGTEVSAYGDLDGDGLDDILASGLPSPSDDVFVVLASALLDAGDGIVGTPFGLWEDTFGVRIEAGSDPLGIGISTVEDLDGDQLPELLVGAPVFDRSADAPSAFVVFSAAIRAALDAQELIDLDQIVARGQGVSLVSTDRNPDGGPVGDQRFTGLPSVGVGDVNGDGIDDVLVCSPGIRWHAFLVLGQALVGARDAAGTLDLETIAGSGRGVRIVDGVSRGRGCSAAAAAGDVDGDGYDDVLIGAPSENQIGQSGVFPITTGRAYLILGASLASELSAEADGVIDFDNFEVDEVGIAFESNDAATARLIGLSVAGAGDVNGDGFDDFLIGDPGIESDDFDPESPFDRGSDLPGRAYVIYGGADLRDAIGGVVELGSVVDLGVGAVLTGAGDNGFGFSVGSAGDVTGDGIPDVLVGAPFDGPRSPDVPSARVDFQRAYLVSGAEIAQPSRVAVEEVLAGLNHRPNAGVVISAVDDILDDVGDSDDIGWAVSAAGDVDGDGAADILVGAPGGDGRGNFEEDSGEVYVVRGATVRPISAGDGAMRLRLLRPFRILRD